VTSLESPNGTGSGRRTTKDIRRVLRVAWALASVFLVESVVFGLAVLPGALFWEWHLQWDLPGPWWTRIVFLSMAFVPAYIIFALALMFLSAWSTRLFGWRTPDDAQMRIADLDWELLRWVRYMVGTHIVRVFAGTLFRGSPVWTAYLRLNGARVGRRVYVNTLAISDHNLLELGDDVVIGAGVHISGHTVERGIVKTAPVRLGRGVTVGLGTVVDIGVEAGPGCQIAPLSVVLKHTTLDAGAVYGGVAVRRLP
jgi:acetyltransferase-like isoleucine patch superfamily enzyme